MTRRILVLRTTALAGAVVTALAGVGSFWLAVRLPALGAEDPGGTAAAAPFMAGMVVLSLAGMALVRQQPYATIGWLLLASGCTGAVARLALATAVHFHDQGYAGAAWLGWLTNWSWVPAQALALQLILRFPDGMLPTRRWRVVEVALWLWAVAAVIVTAVLPGDLGAEQLAPRQNPLGLQAAGELLNAVLSITFLLAPALAVCAVAAPLSRWRHATPDQRHQLRLVMGALLLVAVSAPLAMATDAGQVLEGLAWLVLPAAIALAVLRRRLWDLDLRRRFDRLRLVREEERSRLQRDLHDSLGPLLASISMRLEAARNLLDSNADRPRVDAVLDAVDADAQAATVEVRRIVDELGPAALADADLVAAVGQLVDSYEKGPRVSLLVPTPAPKLDPAAEIAAFRIIGEALRNVVRHADASHCTVSMEITGGDLTLEVTDDGIGLAGAPAGVGRRGMADRAAALGGTLDLVDRPGGGLTVRAYLPSVVR
ncbi:MAG TPA: histidine kinase [Actinomycetales bacterium]|nr:histidine kinase [Actinomycetales bacterium]